MESKFSYRKYGKHWITFISRIVCPAKSVGAKSILQQTTNKELQYEVKTKNWSHIFYASLHLLTLHPKWGGQKISSCLHPYLFPSRTPLLHAYKNRPTIREQIIQRPEETEHTRTAVSYIIASCFTREIIWKQTKDLLSFWTSCQRLTIWRVATCFCLK